MKIQITCVDPILIGAAIGLAGNVSAWWLIMIPIVVSGWFVNPRWSKAEGFRFWN